MIDLIDVSKSYGPGLPAVNHANLHIDKGEFVFVVGNSGSGKTTLIKLLMKELDSTSGQIIVSGERLEGMKHRRVAKYRRKLGVVFQDFRLLKDRNVYENVAFAQRVVNSPTRVIRKRVPEVLQEVGLAVKYKSFPDELSGGEQQRVAIAVALANEPEILLADEPTGAVDTKTSSNIQDLFRKLNRELGLTIIIVTHDMKLAHKVDRVVMISDGKISTEKILKQHYRDMLDQLESPDMTDETHEEYSVLDKAHRVQLSDDMLAAAGIDTNKVKVRIEDGRVVIEAEEKKE